MDAVYFDFDSRFVEKLLVPLSMVTDRAIIKIMSDRAEVISGNASKTIIFAGIAPIESNIKDGDSINLNVINVIKLRDLLSYIKGDGFVRLVIHGNHLLFKNQSIRFKFFLTENGIISETPIKMENIERFQRISKFDLSRDNIMGILKMKSINKDVEKIYFKFREDGVYGEFTDKTLENCDSIEQKLVDEYEGGLNSLGIPISFDIIRYLAQSKESGYTVSSDENKVFLFENMDNSQYSIKYLTSSLIN